MIHRLHASPRSRWAAWIWDGAGGHSLLARGELTLGEQRCSLAKLLPLYRALTTVEVGDGRSCSFWWDCWLPCGPIATTFPALFSHSTDAEVTVWQVRGRDIASFLVPRLTRVGERELLEVSALVAELPIKEGADERRLRHASAPRGALSSGSAYKLLRFGGVDVSYTDLIWGSRAPSRVKFFCWLLVQRRIHTRDILLRKCIVSAEDAGCPLCSATLETADHMLFACPFVGDFWRRVGVPIIGTTMGDLAGLATAAASVVESEVEFALLCCWQLWKHCNAVVFQRQHPSIARVLGCCREDAVLWRGRLLGARRPHVGSWLCALSP